MAQTAKKGNSQLKRLLGNKNTVTLLGILICIFYIKRASKYFSNRMFYEPNNLLYSF